MKNFVFRASTALALVTLYSAQAHAQETTPPVGDDSPGDIVVTAQRRSESINKVPLSIQAFSGEQLANAGVTDASSLPLLTSGLNFAKSSANTPIFTMRGVGFNTPNLSSTSPVGGYYNEVAYAYPYMNNGPLFDLARVEVLKGPQGTLYGRNTTGGLINFITARPGNTLEAGLTGELGNYETHNSEGYISGPLTDTLGIRIAGRWEKSDKGWQQSITRDDRLGKKDRLALRGTLVWEPSDRFSLDFTASYWRDRSDNVATQASSYSPEQPAFVAPGVESGVRSNWTSTTADWDAASSDQPPYKTRSDFYALALRMSYKLNDALSLVSLTSYNHVKRNDMNDVDGTASAVFSILSSGHVGSFGQELRLVGETERMNYTVGANYSSDDIADNLIGYYGQTSTRRLLAFLAQNVVDPTNSRYTAEQYADGLRLFRNTTEQSARSASVFGNLDYRLTDTLKLSGGIRYTSDRLSFDACSGDVDGNTLPIWNTAVHYLINAVTSATPNFLVQRNDCFTYAANFIDLASFERPSLKQNNLAGKIGLQYAPDSQTLIYATISRGFKSGAVPMLPTNVETQLDPAKQEKVTAYEIGAKIGLTDRAIQLNLAAYYYDYRNKQLFAEVPDPVFTTLTRLINVPRSRVYGGEANLDIRPTSGLSLHFGAAYTNSRILQYDGFDRSGQAQDFAGVQFAYTPEWQFNGSVSYDQPINDRLAIAFGADANYQSKAYASLGHEQGFEVDPYTVVNATLALHTLDDKWRVGLYAKNLLNKYYWTSVDTYTDTVFRTPGTAKTYGVRLSWKY